MGAQDLVFVSVCVCVCVLACARIRGGRGSNENNWTDGKKWLSGTLRSRSSRSLPELTVHDTEPQINANKPHLVDEKLHDAKNRHRFLACVECRRGVSKITTQNLKSATIREFVFVCLMAGTDGLSILLA